MAKGTGDKKTVTVVQMGSPIGRRFDQEATLKGLGLNKRHRRRTLEDTPAVRERGSRSALNSPSSALRERVPEAAGRRRVRAARRGTGAQRR